MKPGGELRADAVLEGGGVKGIWLAEFTTYRELEPVPSTLWSFCPAMCPIILTGYRQIL